MKQNFSGQRATAFAALLLLISTSMLWRDAFAQEPTPPEAATKAAEPAKELLEIFPYLGLAVDNFAGNDVNHYINPEESGKVKTRDTFGVAFQYPLAGGDTKSFALWAYGQTTHGVRSAEINCALSPMNPTCLKANLTNTDRAIAILRNATSLEAVLGLRLEVLKIQNGNAALYVSKQFGGVAVPNSNDVANVSDVAIGARIRQGRFRNSFLEVGRGRNDLFHDNRTNRKKISARVMTRLGRTNGKLAKKLSHGFFFAQVIADVDGGSGSDSIQTYIGIAFCPWGKNMCGD